VVARHRQTRRRERAQCPGERRADDGDEAPRVDLAARAARDHEDRDAPEARQHAHDERRGDPVARDEPEDDDPERHRCHHERGEPRWHRAFREHDEAVAAGEKQHADERGAPELFAFDAQGGASVSRQEPRSQERAREEEAETRRQQRWKRLHRDGDREIRGSPHEVNDPERGPHANARWTS